MILSVRPTLNRQRKHHPYTRLLGLSLLFCNWDDNGNLLARPYQVSAQRADFYEVHHLRHWCSCQLKAGDILNYPKVVVLCLSLGL